MFEYKCNGICQKNYYSALEYSDLESVIKNNNICCGIPVWYSDKQRDYLLENNVHQLSRDYAIYMKDMVKHTSPKLIDETGQLYFDFRGK